MSSNGRSRQNRQVSDKGGGPQKNVVVQANISRLQPSPTEAIETWPWLDQELLHTSRSHQVCMTCHCFRHHPGPNGIPLLTCHQHQALIAHGDHLILRCSGWTEALPSQLGWSLEVA